MSAGVPVGDDPLLGRLVRLRELREEDLPTLCRWWSDPTTASYQNHGPQHPRPADAVAEMFRAWSRNEGAGCGLSVITVEGGKLAGHAAVYGATVKDRCGTLAILMGPEFRGRGLGTDAVRVIVRYGFTELGLHRIELTVFDFNAQALAAYRKVGFVEEGRRREALYRSDEWHDMVLMGLLRSEWTG